jgi:hypothetical protein
MRLPSTPRCASTPSSLRHGRKRSWTPSSLRSFRCRCPPPPPHLRNRGQQMMSVCMRERERDLDGEFTSQGSLKSIDGLCFIECVHCVCAECQGRQRRGPAARRKALVQRGRGVQPISFKLARGYSSGKEEEDCMPRLPGGETLFALVFPGPQV